MLKVGLGLYQSKGPKQEFHVCFYLKMSMPPVWIYTHRINNWAPFHLVYSEVYVDENLIKFCLKLSVPPISIYIPSNAQLSPPSFGIFKSLFWYGKFDSVTEPEPLGAIFFFIFEGYELEAPKIGQLRNTDEKSNKTIVYMFFLDLNHIRWVAPTLLLIF